MGKPAARDIPTDYLASLKPYLQQKPVVVTNIVTIDATTPRELALQAAYIRALQTQSYWLDAKVVARPEIRYREPASWPEGAQTPLEVLATAMRGWEAIPRWERVTRLTLSPPESLQPSTVAAGTGNWR